jgi:hypothetical protein
MSDLINYIPRNEGAELLGIGIKSLWRLEQKGLIPTPSVKILNVKTKREIVAYDRAIFESWVKTNPVVKNPRRQTHYADKAKTAYKEVVHDVWNIRKSGRRRNFEYSGHAKNVILFCQNKLLYRGYNFD